MLGNKFGEQQKAASSPKEDCIQQKCMRHINSEGFLAEVFYPWVRWEGPGSGFENSSGGGAGVWAQVGGPKLGPRGWAQVGGPRIHRFGPLGVEVEKQGFRTVRLITGQKFP